MKLQDFETATSALCIIDKSLHRLFAEIPASPRGTDEWLRLLCDEDERALGVFMHSVLSSTLKMTSFSLYDFYKGDENIEKKIAAAKIAVGAASPLFGEITKRYPSIGKAVESDDATRVFTQAYRWLHEANLFRIDAEGIVDPRDDDAFEAYTQIFSFADRADMVRFASAHASNFIAFCVHKRGKHGDEAVRPHLYFVCKYRDQLFLLRQGSDVDASGLMQTYGDVELQTPFTNNVGQLYVANALFDSEETGEDTSHLPAVNGFGDKRLQAASFDCLSEDQKLFIAFCHERIREMVVKAYGDDEVEVVRHMSSAKMLPRPDAGEEETIMLCEAPISKRLYHLYAPRLQGKDVTTSSYDFFGSDESFRKMRQYEKEKAIAKMIRDEMAREGIFDKVSIAHGFAGRIHQTAPTLAEQLKPFVDNLPRVAKSADVIRLYSRQSNGREWEEKQSSAPTGRYNYHNSSCLSIGMFDRMSVKRGYGKYNSYDQERRAEWREVGSRDADHAACFTFFSIFSLVDLLGEDVIASFPLALQLLFTEQHISQTGRRGVGISKSHFDLRSPIDELVSLYTFRNQGIDVIFAAGAADVEAISEVIEDRVAKECEGRETDQFHKCDVKTGIPTYMLDPQGKLQQSALDERSVGKARGIVDFTPAGNSSRW